MALKVQFDHQAFDYQTFGGISRYFNEVIRRSATDAETDFFLTARYSHNEYISDRRISNHISIGKNFHPRIKRHIFTRWNQYYSLSQLKHCEIFHPTYYSDYFLNKVKRTGKPTWYWQFRIRRNQIYLRNMPFRTRRLLLRILPPPLKHRHLYPSQIFPNTICFMSAGGIHTKISIRCITGSGIF